MIPRSARAGLCRRTAFFSARGVGFTCYFGRMPKEHGISHRDIFPAGEGSILFAGTARSPESGLFPETAHGWSGGARSPEKSRIGLRKRPSFCNKAVSGVCPHRGSGWRRRRGLPLGGKGKTGFLQVPIRDFPAGAFSSFPSAIASPPRLSGNPAIRFPAMLHRRHSPPP